MVSESLKSNKLDIYRSYLGVGGGVEMKIGAWNVSRVLVVVTIALLASLIVVAIPINARPSIIRVPQDYLTIQPAVDSAVPGDVIIVGPGEWYGATVDKAVEIRGAQAVIVDGPLLDDSTFNCGFFLEIGLSGVRISGFTFMVDLPIFGRYVNNVVVEQNVMIDPLQGVTCRQGSGWVIKYNKVYGIQHVPTYFGAGILIISVSLSDPPASDNLVAFNHIIGDFPDPRALPPIGIFLSSGGGIVTGNKVVHNQVVMAGSGPQPLPPTAIVMSCINGVGSFFYDNNIGFNDLRGSNWEIIGWPPAMHEDFWTYNDISRNLGANRAYDGVPATQFIPLI